MNYIHSLSAASVIRSTRVVIEHVHCLLVLAISDLRIELESVPVESMCESNTNEDFSKNGRRYSPALRKLYYTLLSQQHPLAKIADVVGAVIKCFFPAIDPQVATAAKFMC